MFRLKRIVSIAKKIKSVFVFAAAILSAFLIGCYAELNVIGGIENYEKFLAELKTYFNSDKEDPEDPKDPDIPDLPEFDGPDITEFKPLYLTDFDYTSGFFGKYAFIRKDGYIALLDKEGNALECTVDLEGEEVIYDKYVFVSDGLKGVKDVFGKTVIAAEYEEIQIFENTVAATRGNGITEVFSSGELAGSFSEKVELVSEEFLLTEQGLCSIDTTRITCCGYVMISAPSNGIAVIYDGEQYCGYGNLSGEIITPFDYVAAYPFLYGHGVAIRKDGTWVVINENGDEIISYDGNDRTFVSYDGDYLIYSRERKLHVSDLNMNDKTDRVFDNITGSKVYNGYIITDNGTRIYSLETEEFVFGTFASVVMSDGYVVCKSENGSFSVYDTDFDCIVSNAEYADFRNGILTVKCDGKYYLYERG